MKEIIIKGRLKGGKVVLFGKQWGWLRRATMFRFGGHKFDYRAPISDVGFSERVDIPGPVDGKVTATLLGGQLNVQFDIVTDKGGLVVQSFEFDSDLANKPQKFRLRALGAEVSGTVELV